MAYYGQNACSAWVRFKGTSTVTIDNDYNVSSVTDHGTGDYSINFSSALANINYSVGGFAHRNGSTSGRVICHIDLINNQSTSYYRFNVSGTTNSQVVGLSNVDTDRIYLQFFNG